MRAAAAFVLLLVGCRAPARTTTSHVVPVATVTAPPLAITSKPACGPDEAHALEVDDALGRRIRAICIRGVDEATAHDVQTFLRSKIGVELDGQRVHDDVLAIYESGQFRRVDVLAGTKDDGVELTFDLEPRRVTTRQPQ